MSYLAFKIETDDSILVIARTEEDTIRLEVIQSPHMTSTILDDENLIRLRDRCDVLLNRKRESDLVP